MSDGTFRLAAYLALRRRAGPAPAPPDTPRPEGPLVWAHAVDGTRADALSDLAIRLGQARPGLTMLLTTPGTRPMALRGTAPVIWQPLPPDRSDTAETFLGHWRPDLGLWTGGNLQPAILHHARRIELPMLLVDAEAARLDRAGSRLLPDLRRVLLPGFGRVLARSADAVRVLRRLGVPEGRIELTGPFRDGAIPLPYHLDDRDDLAALLRGRPLWLAAMVQPAEVEVMLAAHRAVSRIAHRALLILVPDNIEDAQDMHARLDAGGWRHIVWSGGEMPGETTQIILADTRGEMGLWYRLAPVTFMGSSLVSGQAGRDPNEPAAHGSAILYGPNVGRYLARYSRYAEAGAARIVRDQATLAAALQRLIAPDQAATMAHAAWDVASEGAAVTDRILDLVLETLDEREATG